jgi:hypothetical protein
MSGTKATQVHNERTKLLATALNNLALAIVVAGFVAPAISGQLRGGSQTVATLACIIGGIILHLFAQAVLGGIRT